MQAQVYTHLPQGRARVAVPRRRQRQPKEHGPVHPRHRRRGQQRRAQRPRVEAEAAAAVQHRHPQLAAQRHRLETVAARGRFEGWCAGDVLCMPVFPTGDQALVNAVARKKREAPTAAPAEASSRPPVLGEHRVERGRRRRHLEARRAAEHLDHRHRELLHVRRRLERAGGEAAGGERVGETLLPAAAGQQSAHLGVALGEGFWSAWCSVIARDARNKGAMRNNQTQCVPCAERRLQPSPGHSKGPHLHHLHLQSHHVAIANGQVQPAERVPPRGGLACCGGRARKR